MKKETERTIKKVERYCDNCGDFIDDEHEWSTRNPCAICKQDICHKCCYDMRGWLERPTEIQNLFAYGDIQARVCLKHKEEYLGFEVKVSQVDFIKPKPLPTKPH